MMNPAGVFRFLSISVLLLAMTFSAEAKTLSSKGLIEKAAELDGSGISYEGELVTAIMNRGEYSWININDGDSAIGVWCESALLKDVNFIGDYKNKGDILEVEGVFHRACPVHGGEMDIHANAIKILKRGYYRHEKPSGPKLNLSISLFLVTMLIVVVFKKRL